jgi:hypothetical protein
LTALVLASPALTFAGGQNRIYPTPSKSDTQDRTSVTKAVQFGKGTGITRNDRTLSGNAYRAQTAADNGTVKNDSGSRPNYSDRALRK